MRSLRHVSAALVLTTSSALGVSFVVACGVSSPPAATAPGNPGAPTSEGAPPADAGTSPPAAPSSPTTTTVTLGDAGDVQGTKLQSATSSSSTAEMPDAGPGRGPHQAEPGRSVKDIQVIVQAHRDEARACYDQAQLAHPDPSLKGNLDVKWTIDPTGKVTAIGIDDAKSDIHDPAIGKCVVEIIKGIHFAVSGKGFETRAHYPFNFNPHNAPHAPGAR